ncbi:hypothetical protein WOLCODRAFT_158982 [Wolfiporia cocos MD-104 SS10]|uniref:Uncharacterized protein n=1 Tax=Wolfiporia cocos (strain MD-104) TaxID=742152 RepID=A0A2H3JNV1_WOLCO|nr:hypothetical protein WOLCODRAFT_158982 [Wolfiporia cocos MD-104 SS10]
MRPELARAGGKVAYRLQSRCNGCYDAKPPALGSALPPGSPAKLGGMLEAMYASEPHGAAQGEWAVGVRCDTGVTCAESVLERDRNRKGPRGLLGALGQKTGHTAIV